MSLSKYLIVFNRILSQGEKIDDKYHLGELYAWHDLDGYSCFIGYKEVVMNLYFHGRFSYDYVDEVQLNEFKALVHSAFESNGATQ